jgi:hypothetical protein
LSTDPWLGALLQERHAPAAQIRKFKIVSVDLDGLTTTLQTTVALNGSDQTNVNFTVRFPKSVQPVIGWWAWTLVQNGQVWPFATDEPVSTFPPVIIEDE